MLTDGWSWLEFKVIGSLTGKEHHGTSITQGTFKALVGKESHGWLVGSASMNLSS
jgi:hypothetical protein